MQKSYYHKKSNFGIFMSDIIMLLIYNKNVMYVCAYVLVFMKLLYVKWWF